MFRIGAYQPIPDMVHVDDDDQQQQQQSSSPPARKRMIAGGISGALGFFVCNPFEIVRKSVQVQPIPGIGSANAAPTVVGRITLRESFGKRTVSRAFFVPVEQV